MFTQDEIIELARQVWLSDYGSKVLLGGEDVEINLEDIEAFAELVADAAASKERDRIVEAIKDHTPRSGHQTPEYLFAQKIIGLVHKRGGA